jgi:hypothetical protein
MTVGALGILEKSQVLTVIAVECFHGDGAAAGSVGQARQCALFERGAESDNHERLR